MLFLYIFIYYWHWCLRSSSWVSMGFQIFVVGLGNTIFAAARVFDLGLFCFRCGALCSMKFLFGNSAQIIFGLHVRYSFISRGRSSGWRNLTNYLLQARV